MAVRRRRPTKLLPTRLLQAGLLVLALMISLPGALRAQVGSSRYSSIIVDQASGKVLQSDAADDLRYPASLTKLMTLYVTFEALRDHRVGLDQAVPVSAHAASMEPSKLGLVPGTYLTVEDAINGIVTKSANDAACALGELLGGDEERFAQMMTLRARALGMSNSTFRNASGLPDLEQMTTARDLAVLAHHLISDFPDQYHYFSTPSFTFHGRVIFNHDRMLQSYDGADGLKTGYTVLSGHNLVTSAMRGGVRLIGVVMGAASNPERDVQMASLLDDGFESMGVPVMRRAAPPPRLPSLMAAAEAETLPVVTRWRHGRRERRVYAAAEPRRQLVHLRHYGSHASWSPQPRVQMAVARGRILHASGGGSCAHRHGRCRLASL